MLYQFYIYIYILLILYNYVSFILNISIIFLYPIQKLIYLKKKKKKKKEEEEEDIYLNTF